MLEFSPHPYFSYKWYFIEHPSKYIFLHKSVKVELLAQTVCVFGDF